jgi:hypothetical protein
MDKRMNTNTLTHEEVNTIAVEVEALLEDNDAASAVVREKLTDFLVNNFIEQVAGAKARREEMLAYQEFLASQQAEKVPESPIDASTETLATEAIHGDTNE